jgi:hypothetical protein
MYTPIKKTERRKPKRKRQIISLRRRGTYLVVKRKGKTKKKPPWSKLRASFDPPSLFLTLAPLC